MIILNFLTDANGNTDWFRVIIGIAILILIIFLSREFNIWYLRINDFIKNQEEQIRLLKKIAEEESDDNSEKS